MADLSLPMLKSSRLDKLDGTVETGWKKERLTLHQLAVRSPMLACTVQGQITLVPVSYTHLDHVQTLNHTLLPLLHRADRVVPCPVSYTHLDVYKRQIQYTTMVKSIPLRKRHKKPKTSQMPKKLTLSQH